MQKIFGTIMLMLVASSLSAQISIGINFNVDNQPIWGPTGYDYVEYYYLPDIETYYNVTEKRFYYWEGNRWIGRSNLPARYNHYDIYNSYKVVVNEKEPWRRNKIYKDKYFSYRGIHNQQMIKYSHDKKYFSNKNHPEHNNWSEQQNNGNRKNIKKSDNNQKQNLGNKNDKRTGNNDNKTGKNNKEKNNKK